MVGRSKYARRRVLAAGVLLTAAITLPVGLNIGRFVAEGWCWAALLAIPGGVAAVDLVTGMVHWACDRFGDADTPVVGPLLIRAFRDHHADPEAMLRHDWIETNGEASLSAALVLVTLELSAPFARSNPSVFLWTLVWTMAALGAWANQVHKWAHLPRAPRSVRTLQSLGLALHPDHHACHHRATHDSGYCISTGWMNPVLDRLGFWSRLERSLRRAT